MSATASPPSPEAPPARRSPEQQVILEIEGMHCGACAARVEKVAGGLDGVTAANVNLATERLDLHYDPARINLDEIGQAIRAAGS